MSLEYTPHASGGPPNNPARRAPPVQPPLINTAVPASALSYGRHGYPQTAASALAVNTPLTALSTQSAFPLRNGIQPALSPMAYRTPATAVTTYNPQEWQRSRPLAGSYVPHAPTSSFSRSTGTRDATGMEASMPSPPPPYSPSPTQTISQNLQSPPQPPNSHYAITQSPSLTQSQFSPDYTSSPLSIQPGMHHDNSTRTSPSFPPPPGPRDRSTSRTRGKFSLSAFRQKNSEPSSSTTAMESLQNYTNDALARIPRQNNTPSPQPPSSRRSASTSAVNTAMSPSQNTVQLSEGLQARLPLHIPPPPPGPPPVNRSQSMDRSQSPSASSVAVTLSQIAPHTRRPSIPRSNLGPVPPTPADWTEEDDQPHRQNFSPFPQSIRANADPMEGEEGPSAEGEEIRKASYTGSITPPRPSSSSSHTVGLSRTPAKRDLSAKGIRERRNESRTRRVLNNDEPEYECKTAETLNATESIPATPLDLVLTNATRPDRRRLLGKATSALNSDSDRPTATPDHTEKANHRRPASSSDPTSLNLDTRNLDRETPQSAFTQTPPFSPDDQKSRLYSSKSSTTSISKGLPTPPPNRQSYHDQIPFSMTNGGSSPAQLAQINNMSFAKESLDRYTSFVERESAATTEREKLEIFAAFMVHESRIRRDRYSQAFDSLGSNVLDLTRDMWRTLNTSHMTESSTRTSNASTSRIDPNQSFTSGSTPTSATVMSESELGSPASASSYAPTPTKSPWTTTNYQPCLSPIPSMAMSTVPDEQDSRGRSASRWWDASVEGSVTDAGRKLHRSKRESKYMGLPKDQWDASELSPGLSTGTPGPSQTFYNLGPNEYPVEKTGFDQENLMPPPPPSLPVTPMANQLDVSRLITLPPPYPRHHPAVNNNHPELADMRATLRTINDLQDLQAAKELYSPSAFPDGKVQELLASSSARRKEARSTIQEKISSGEISFAEAAKHEADFEADIMKQSREDAQADFERFKTEVMTPMQTLLTEKVGIATASIDQLRKSLSHDAQNRDPTQTQEEGDEQPELLEKLTILKWVFEAREVLHKELFILQGEGDRKYSRVILTPYIVTNNTTKIHEVESFFRTDAQKRTVTHEKEVYSRAEDFLRIIDANVTRGVEIQLSAFWDIAPALNTVVAKIPSNLQTLSVLIPPQEYSENASYYEFPTQYLYSLLEHAGKSTYQFIESQTNLLCLLHEVRTAVTAAGCKLMETQRVVAGEPAADVEVEMKAIRKDEEAGLTVDLKEKVNLVDDQWMQALGKGLEECKSRIRADLEDRGGWDDCLQE